ncbi:M20/M25/M40 family metallo-hydrolase [Furfurilactobacillus milii]|uniref:M20/M25/M40 family metallo-hydrolase n=1 Tax=Furfurilactobacillus milii TaxID=2888272 RepID=A0A6N9I246_9LACO|nr:M20/M25/M40 family metallo-hydrolase [Furfurilactobacillus milii]MYV17222.1 M20/M25/M40 family metallo-hydrolase [Furfurilactobacillus milii]
MNKREVEDYAIANLSDVEEYITIPSISAQGTGINETSDWLVNEFKSLGASTVEKWHDQGGNPVVFAAFKGAKQTTVLFYNHYDVQPPEPLDEWHSDPFKLTQRDGKMFARGVCDDKGELMSRLTLIKYFNEHGGLPVNLKFFVEGEEEVGSPHVGDYLKAHAAELKADVCLWEGGGKNAVDHFEVTCGLKGIATFELSVQTADVDIHSSLASYADNAVWRLMEAVTSLRGKDGRVKVSGFYDNIKPLSSTETAAVEQMDFDGEAVKNTFGLKGNFVYPDPKTELVNGTTLTVNGIMGGYAGAGVKTIIPRSASAKLDCRLVPGQEPAELMNLIRKQLNRNGFSDVEMKPTHAELPFRTNLDDPFVKLNVKIAKQVYGDENVRLVPNMPGSGPAGEFANELGKSLPIVMVGVHYAASKPHSPNENIRQSDYQEGTYFLGELLTAVGAQSEEFKVSSLNNE